MSIKTRNTSATGNETSSIHPEEQNKLPEGLSEHLLELTITLLRVNQQDKLMHMHAVIPFFF